MPTHLKRRILTLFILALVPAGLRAQEQAPVAPSELPQEAQELVTEIRQVQASLDQIRQQALADPELRAEQAAIGEELQVAMAKSDPEVPQQLARLQTLMGEAQAAQAEQDAARMQQIVSEAREIEGQLQAAQAAAIQQPELAPRVQSFQEKLQERMVEVDPTTPQLIQRLRELDLQIAAYVSSGQ